MTRLYDARDIAKAKSCSQQAVHKRLKRTPVAKHTPHAGKDIPWWDYDHLPADYQQALDKHVFDAAHGKNAVLPAPTLQTLLAPASSAAGALPAAGSNAAAGLSLPKKRADGSFVTRGQVRKPKAEAALDDKDRAYRDNALILCRTVDTAMVLADCSEKRAIVELATRLVGGDAKEELIAAAHATYLKPRKSAGPLGGLNAQISRLQHIMAFYRAGLAEGDAGKYLIAGRVKKVGQKPEDIAAFLRHFCRPCRPPVSEAWKKSADWYAEHGFARPSVHVFRRIARDLPVTLKYRGRMTGAAYRALLPYISRDVSMFKANDLWVGDGHTFKARVKSPLTGKAFRPEVTVILDWVSRKIVGWSVDLAESTIAVSAALRHAQLQTRARPLVYYSDNGSGQTGKKIDHPITGTAARQGFDHQTGIPGNPQGRGIIERLWPSVLMTLARSYPTFLTKDGDRDEIRKVGQALAKADRAGEDSPLLPSFEQFIADLCAVVEAYNSGHNHSALGDRTPNEVYAEKLDPTSIAFGVDDDEIRALWMPEEIRTHQRGVVSLYNNQYFRADLVDRLSEKETLRVRFDIHDASQVWLYRMDGSEIGVAAFEGNKRAAFPVSYIEMKRDERADGIIARAHKEIERAEAERAITVEAEAERVPEIVKWLEPAAEPAQPEPEKTLLDYLPEKQVEPERNLDFMETAALYADWLRPRRSDADAGDDEENTGGVGRAQAGADAAIAAQARRHLGLGAADNAGVKPSFDFMGQRPGLADLPALTVIELTGEEFGKGLSHRELVAAASDRLRAMQGGPGLPNDDTGWDLRINKNGRKKMGDNEEQSAAELKAVAGIDGLARNAVVAESHPDLEHHNEFVRAVYRLYVPLSVDGNIYRVKLTVKDYTSTGNPKALHALAAVEIENAPLGTLPTSSAEALVQSGQPTAGRTMNIADLLKNANMNDGTPFDL